MDDEIGTEACCKQLARLCRIALVMISSNETAKAGAGWAWGEGEGEEEGEARSPATPCSAAEEASPGRVWNIS